MIYLDNSATTIVYPSVVDVMCDVLKNDYGNPSSLHRLGMNAENIINDARATFAKSIGAKDNEVYFAPSGTLANNTAILGYLNRNKRAGNKIMVSAVEHPSVYNVFVELKAQGYEVLEIPIKNNALDYNFIEENLSSDVALISVMLVNNETGTIFDINKIRAIINSKRLQTVIHSDCIQGYLKIPINVNTFSADMITVSAHKIGGPKGIGGLFVKNGIKISPIYYGGGQEKSIFSGTENVVNIAGFNEAIKVTLSEKPMDKIDKLNKIFLENLNSNIKINSENNLSCILNISLNLRSEIALHTLESMGIFVSSGSACSQKKGEKNRVLKNFSLPQNIQDTALRISFGHQNTEEEILDAVAKINEIYEKMKKN